MPMSGTFHTQAFESTVLAPQVRNGAGLKACEWPRPRQPGGYTSLRVVGIGATSVVYSAQRMDDGKQVALKQLKLDLASANHAVADFLSEARLLLGLRHPNLIQCDDFFFDQGAWWLVLEYLPGGTINQVCANRFNVSRSQKADWMNQIAKAISYLHAHGIVHGDVKPGNILVDGRRAVLADLGLACFLKQPRHRQNRICGTPEFMSQEACRGIICPENDWYAFRQTAARMGVA